MYNIKEKPTEKFTTLKKYKKIFLGWLYLSSTHEKIRLRETATGQVSKSNKSIGGGK